MVGHTRYYPLETARRAGYVLYGCVYSLFRLVGIDPYLSAELVNVVFRAIGFFSFYLAMRQIFSARLAWALLGATLFTLSNSVFIQAVHAQLFGVSLVPFMAILIVPNGQAP